MLTLFDYLKEQNQSLSAFAVRIGRAPSTLSRALAGERNPSIDLARDVERGTGGRVSASSFIQSCLDASTPEAAE